jgi:cation diffusion facilitator family transporter
MGYTRSQSQVGRRIQAVKRVLWWVLFLNLLVAGAKLGYGLLIDSVSITADGFHSMFDGTSNIIGLLGMGLASRPADKDHPYGHAKYETFASAAIGALLLFAAWRVGSSAFERLMNPGAGPQVDALSFTVMLATLAVNIAVTTLERRAGKRLGSEILVADASHTASDVLVTIGVIGGLIAVRLGFPIADPILGVVVAVFIIAAAVRVLRAAGMTLADAARIPPHEVCEAAKRVPGVLGCHEIRTRGSANEVYVDLHIQVEAGTTVEQGHEIAEQVEKSVCNAFAEIVDVIAHLEPLDEYQQAKTADQAQHGLL